MPHAAYRLSRHPFRLILSAALGIALLTAQGCAGPSGSAQLYNPKSDALGRVFPDKLDMSKAVMKTDPNRDLKGKDVFALYLSDAYFKYLPDFSGSNEVVIVAEFTEVSAGDKGDTVTTVLGPTPVSATPPRRRSSTSSCTAPRNWRRTRSASPSRCWNTTRARMKTQQPSSTSSTPSAKPSRWTTR